MKVKELLADPARWTQGEFARNADGCKTSSDDDHAVCWCLSGAIKKCYPDLKEREKAANKLIDVLPENYDGAIGIYIFNDSSTHAEVMKLLEEADV